MVDSFLFFLVVSSVVVCLVNVELGFLEIRLE